MLPDTNSIYSRASIHNVRAQWSGKLDFFFSCLGYTVGMGNIWRFPYLTYKNGGGAFFLPYLILLFFVGIPLFLLELTIGQFSSSGPTACWEFCILFQGCGIAMALVSALTSLYYNIIMAWSLFFFFASFNSSLPWSHCGEWSSKYCSENVLDVNKSECIANGGKPIKDTGICENPINKSNLLQLWDRDAAKMHGISIHFPAEEYFRRRVTGMGTGNDLSNIGSIRCELVLCNLLVWIFVAFCLANGIKSLGKVVYITVTVPYLLLLILLMRALALEGSVNGIKYFLVPDMGRLTDMKVWKDAAAQVFFSSSLAFGGLITLASYNKFHNDVIRDSLIISIGDCLASVFCGLVTFAFLGFLSHSLNADIDSVTAKDTALVFGVYPFGLTKLPAASFWSVIFFIMVVLLGIDSQFMLVETIITSITDLKPSLRGKKYITVSAVCIALFLLGLPMTCNGGVDVLTLLDFYVGRWSLLVIAICECIAVSYFYGASRFINDLNVMVGGKFCCNLEFSSILKSWCQMSWMVLCPVVCSALIILSWAFDKRTETERFPKWADFVGWSILLLIILCIVVTGLIRIYMAEGTCLQKVKIVSTPSSWWGPAQIEHRILVKEYAPDIEIIPEVVLPHKLNSQFRFLEETPVPPKEPEPEVKTESGSVMSSTIYRGNLTE